MNIFCRTLDAEMKLACQDGLTNSTKLANREEVTEKIMLAERSTWMSNS
jgi:hypothetical protein